ncbi:MAG: aspartate dehydrogenase [Lachnospiraceae bacterium]|nr:aspartate dehydrogenase [Lachnospiraceae bacterium]
MKFVHLFTKKTKETVPERCFDPEKEKPIIRASICTGEKVAGFKDKRTGAFREVLLIRNQKDLEGFKKACGVEQIDTEY